MMTIIITVNQPRKDWGGMNIKRFVYLKDFNYISVDEDGIRMENGDDSDEPDYMVLDIPDNEISNISIMYPK